MGIKDRAIVTICIGDVHKEIGKISHPTMINYANKVEADFICITEDSCDVSTHYPSPHWAKLLIYDLLKEYPRILYLDTDTIIRDDCPNLFDEIPKEKIGAFNEGKFAPRSNILLEGERVYQLPFDHRKHSNDYWNTGVLVLSRFHRSLFKLPSEFVDFSLDYGEQTFLNLRILNDPLLEVENLKYYFNRMSLMDSFLGEDRLASYILHYAGCPSPELLLTIMKKDLGEWERDSPNYKYKRRILIEVTGGLGDQISAEPTIRFAARSLYSEDYVYVNTPYPTLFNHLKDEIILVDQSTSIGDKAVAKFRTCPVENDDTDHLASILSHPLIHPVDFASLAVFRYILPDKHKKINLEVTKDGIEEVFDITKTEDLSDTVLIHPGKGWPSKTFPNSWWSTLIDLILSTNRKVGLIGKRLNEDQGYMSIKCPSDCYDFRDLLSLEGVIAAISLFPILITNDSAPLHIAGAFDNWLILIPTCKHPDYLLPYRNGGSDKNYKALAVYKDLTCNYVATAPTSLYGGSIDKVYKGEILDYLPDPKELITYIESCK